MPGLVARAYDDRSITLSPKRYGPAERELWAAEGAGWVDELRPRTRADCKGGPRPCPWVGCRYHLWCDVSSKGGLKLNWPEAAPWEMAVTCTLDAAEDGPRTLDDVGALVNLTRERVRQIEERIIGVMDHRMAGMGEDGPLLTCGAVLKEAEVKIVEAAARIIEIDGQIAGLEREKRTLLEKLASLSLSRRGDGDHGEGGQDGAKAREGAWAPLGIHLRRRTAPGRAMTLARKDQPAQQQGLPLAGSDDASRLEWLRSVLVRAGGEPVALKMLRGAMPQRLFPKEASTGKKMADVVRRDLERMAAASEPVRRCDDQGKPRSWRWTEAEGGSKDG